MMMMMMVVIVVMNISECSKRAPKEFKKQAQLNGEGDPLVIVQETEILPS